jgi:hypothetical protein
MGGALIVTPLLMLSIAGWIVMQRINQTVMLSSVRTSSARLADLTRNLADICRSHQQASIEILQSGRAVLDAAGSITFDEGRLISWQARNEATGEIAELQLPVMSAGATHFLPLADSSLAPLVDEIERINGTPATIFQRMDERGDMLRVSSSMKSPTGVRDIGSYIPVTPASQESEALIAVLNGKNHVVGGVFSNANYLTLSQPLHDESGAVVGMLSTALPEKQITAKIRSFADRQSSVDRAGLFAWRASGADQGTVLIMADNSLEAQRARPCRETELGIPAASTGPSCASSLEGQDLWNQKDSSGKLYVQQICARAIALPPGEIAEYKYQQEPRVGAIPQNIIAKFTYLPALDWVVGYAQPEADLLAGATALQALLNWGMWLLLGVGLAGTGLAVRIWIKFSSDLADRLNLLLTNVTENAKRFSVAAAELSAEAKRANRQHGAEQILSQAGRSAAAVDSAMRRLNASSDSFNGVMEAIDQIAFAINILVVNSALEASQAQVPNPPVASIAEDLRQLAEHCRLAARETQTELQQRDHAVVTLQLHAENLLRLAEGLDRTVARVSEYLELDN